MTDEVRNICLDIPHDAGHNFVVIDWAYTGGAPNVHPHTKQARLLLCQKCFVQYDLGMIERARTRLLNTSEA
jgi:hypothetical protein